MFRSIVRLTPNWTIYSLRQTFLDQVIYKEEVNVSWEHNFNVVQDSTAAQHNTNW